MQLLLLADADADVNDENPLSISIDQITLEMDQNRRKIFTLHWMMEWLDKKPDDLFFHPKDKNHHSGHLPIIFGFSKSIYKKIE